MHRLIASLILLTFTGVAGAQPEPVPGSDLRATAASKYLGARSCSATACHANVSLPRSQSIKDSEFIYWLENDPHALALESIDNDRSTEMLVRLGIRNKQGNIVDRTGYQNCLACHNVSRQLDAKLHPVHTDGVSCESCHGPARDWIDQHYTTTWRTMSIAEKSALGFKHTFDLGVRAAVCVSCHVGAPDREVNHDMIAAGHPPLKFELSAYHDLLPKHWNHDGSGNWPTSSTSPLPPGQTARTGGAEKAWPERNADFEKRLWQQGQQEAARAALQLLLHRAKNATQGGLWPELAEYDCFSCHHELRSPSWRQRSSRKGHLRWGSWYFANARNNEPELQELQRIMQALDQNVDQVVDAVGRVLASPPHFESGPPVSLDWDSLAQSYLASVAERVAQLDEASTRGSEVEEDTVFQLQRAVKSKLSFPASFDSPKEVARGESLPDSLTPDAIKKEIEAIFSALGQPAR